MNVNEKTNQPAPTLVQYAETTSLFTLDELRQRYGDRAGDRSIDSALYKLRRQKRVRAVCPGVYSGARSQVPVNRYAVPAKLREDAVVGYHSALEFHGLANQVFQTVY